jgi:rod shape-determining protein MreC
MKWISNLVSGYVRTFHFVIICLLVTALVAGGPQVTSRTSGVIVQVFYYPFSMLRNTIIDLIRVNDDNLRLRQALQETTLLLNQYGETERENERLRGILDYEPPPGYDLFQARVLSVSGTTGQVSAEINRGTRDSIRVDMPVINQQGLIGRVVAVSETVAQVQLLIDPTHRVAARVATSREMGIVKYRNRDGMLLDNFPIQGEIAPGDEILSSGLGGIYPAGLVIGRVGSVVRPEEATFCTVVIEPAVNFNSIEELFVLRIHQP